MAHPPASTLPLPPPSPSPFAWSARVIQRTHEVGNERNKGGKGVEGLRNFTRSFSMHTQQLNSWTGKRLASLVVRSLIVKPWDRWDGSLQRRFQLPRIRLFRRNAQLRCS